MEPGTHISFQGCRPAEIPNFTADKVVAFCDNAIALFDDCEKMEVSHLDLTRLTMKRCSGHVSIRETAGMYPRK